MDQVYVGGEWEAWHVYLQCEIPQAHIRDAGMPLPHPRAGELREWIRKGNANAKRAGCHGDALHTDGGGTIYRAVQLRRGQPARHIAQHADQLHREHGR